MRVLHYTSPSGWKRAASVVLRSRIRARGTVSLARRAKPDLPGPEWVRVRVLRSGVSEQDLALLDGVPWIGSDSTTSPPAALGPEVVGVVEEVGSEAGSVSAGQRVVVVPGLTGATRRHAPDLTGGWSSEVVAHRSQVVSLLDGLDLRRGLLVQPLARALVGVDAALGAGGAGSDGPSEGGAGRSRIAEPGDPQSVDPGGSAGRGPHVLVVGSAFPALATVWALRARGLADRTVLRTEVEGWARLARRLGVTSFDPENDAGDRRGEGLPAIRLEAAALAHGRADLFRPGGSDGTATAIYAQVQELLLEDAAPVEELVTHVFPLRQYRDALRVARRPERTGALRVAFDPTLGGAS